MNRPTQEQSEQLAALWTQAQPVVSAYIRTLLPDFHQAEEVLQRVAVTLVRKFEGYDLQRPFVPWAIGFARFEVLRYRRDHATDRHQFDSDIVEQAAELYQSEEIDFSGFREALRSCVAKLEGRNRQALILRYTQDVGPKEIAQEMTMSANAVRQLLHRVRAALRKCIEAAIAKTGGRP
ncbi:MAG: sigma-70 family RNA polymerase sigma factor [Phycisphaeraceae bacterium]|nr:sigma-70 family RNA polymerase sigma factor [Phycisphaeraceae bacterium]